MYVRVTSESPGCNSTASASYNAWTSFMDFCQMSLWQYSQENDGLCHATDWLFWGLFCVFKIHKNQYFVAERVRSGGLSIFVLGHFVASIGLKQHVFSHIFGPRAALLRHNGGLPPLMKTLSPAQSHTDIVFVEGSFLCSPRTEYAD